MSSYVQSKECEQRTDQCVLELLISAMFALLCCACVLYLLTVKLSAERKPCQTQHVQTTIKQSIMTIADLMYLYLI
jgi:hypothetical protein